MSSRAPWRCCAPIRSHIYANPRIHLAHQAKHTLARPVRKPVARQEKKPAAHNELINPPRSTRPPLLINPSREQFESYWKYLFEVGKGYVTFYKEGLKATLANRKLVKAKLERTPKDDLPSIWNPNFVPKTFSRADWVLLWRNRHDLVRLPIFGLMVIVIGEFTPLVVMLFDGLVPYTCRIPSQLLHSQERAETRRGLVFNEFDARYPGGVFDPKLSPYAARNHVLRTLYLSGDMWEKLRIVPPGMWQIKGKLRMAFLEGDDKNLIKDGGPMDLVNEELRIACTERGINILGKSETELRGWLSDWLRLTAAEDGIERRRRMTVLLLTRPEQWPQTRDFPVPEWTL